MNIVWLRHTTSTMLDAANLAGKGEPHGTAVVAEMQTAGIGRHGHLWHSEAGGGLYVSIILRVELQADSLPVLTMALGLAAQEAMPGADIRWPNDVMLNGRKVAGIMVQQHEPGVLIAGIGVNVNQTGFPPDLRAIATSLRIETGVEQAKHELLESILARCLAMTETLAKGGKQEILRLFETRSSYARGKAVVVDGAIRGVTEGLTPDGFLLVRTADGVRTILTGGVREV